MEQIETRQNVDYAAPLAGHGVGLLSSRSSRILVTEGPRLISPEPGSYETIRAIVEGLLGEEQAQYFYGWLKVAQDALRVEMPRCGQALIIAGPVQCGKSLLQSTIITQMLGGRVAPPYADMTGRTDFNSELFAAEHLMIEDEAASQDPRVRKAFGAQIKHFTVNREQRYHAKG